jgi:hypothetical protein
LLPALHKQQHSLCEDLISTHHTHSMAHVEYRIWWAIPWSLALSFLPAVSPVSALRGGESCADAKPSRVTSEKSFLSLAGGLVDGPAIFPRASVCK